MSWIEDIKERMTIKTGDGKEYFPKWLNVSKSKEFNTSEFDFINVSGTKVDRRLPRGVKYNLEIYFQGAEYLAELKAFETSADDPRPWVVSNPLYGQITVQPLSLTIDLAKYNTAQITGTIMETITDDNPKSVVDAKDKIAADKIVLDANSALSFIASPTPIPLSAIDVINEGNASRLETAKSIVPVDEYENFYNLYTRANAKVLQITSYPLDAIEAVQAFINAPALFTASVKSRVETLALQMSDLNDAFLNVTGVTDKKIYENNGATILSAMAIAASTPLTGDLNSRVQISFIVELMYYWYNQYLALLDSLQTNNGNSTDSFIPDHDTLYGLSGLIDFTIANLVRMSLGAKQERILYLEDDSNVIVLAHRFYGLKDDDSTITEFIENNQIGLNEMLIVKKGRPIKYYI